MTEEEEFEFRARAEAEKKVPVAPAAVASAPASKGSYLSQTLGNVPGSAGRLISDVAHAVTSPVETFQNVTGALEGGVRKLLPESIKRLSTRTPEQIASNEEKANAVGELYKQRYGGAQNIADTFREDPVGVLGDVASVLGGVGGALKVAPAASRAAKVGQVVSNVGNTIDPVMAMGRGAGKLASGAGIAAKNAFGTVSNIDPSVMGQAYQAGKTGDQSFVQHMRGEVPSDVTVGMARDNLTKMRDEMGQRYSTAKGGWADDTTPLNFTPIRDKLTDLTNSLKYRDKWTIGEAEKSDIGRLEKVVETWESDPSAHTVNGLDALKRALSNEHPDPSHRQANRVATALENAVKNEIYAQAPQYAPAMKDYHQRISQINEIEKTLSLGDKASIDTAMRKLQTVSGPKNMRRAELLDQMEQAGGTPIRPALAGQALSEWQPRLRGLGGLGIGALGAGGIAMGNPLMIAGALSSSPRLVGETLNAAGRVAGSAPARMVGKVAGQLPKGIRAGSIATPLDEERVKSLLDALRQNQE